MATVDSTVNIQAVVGQLDQVSALSKTLDAAGLSADGFRKQADGLDAELEQLQSQEALVREFGQLEAAMARTGQQLDATRTRQRQLSDAVVASFAPTQTQVREQRNAEQALVKLGSQLEEQRQRQRAATEAVNASANPTAAQIERQVKATEKLSALNREYGVAEQRLTRATAAVQAGNEPSAKLTREHEKATTALQNLDGQYRQQQTALDALRGKLTAAGVAAGSSQQATASLGAAYEDLRRRSDGLVSSLQLQAKPVQDLQAAFQKLDIKPFKDVQREVDAVRAALQRLEQGNRDGSVSARELAKAQVEAANKIRALQDSTNGMVKTLGDAKLALGAFAASVAGTGLAAAGVLKDYRAFEIELGKISTLVAETPAQLGELADQVNALGGEFGKAPAEQARALYEIISSGAGDAAQSIELLNASNRLAVGGVTDVKTAADGLTSVLAAYGLGVGEATRVSDAFFVAAADGKTTVDELSRSIGQVAPIAAQSGVGLEELLAGVSTLTKGGIKTAEAITGIRGAIAAVIQPSKEASELAASLGLQFDLQGLKAKGLAGFLADVAEKTGGSAEKNAVLFGRVEALNAVLSLTGNQADSFAKTLDNMANKAGKTEEAFAKVASTSDFKFQQLSAETQVATQRLGEFVNLALTPLAEAATAVIKAFNEAPVSIQAAVAIIAAAVPVVVATTTGIRALAGAFTLLKGAAAVAGVKAITSEVDALGGAIGKTSATAGALARGLVSLPAAAVVAALASISFAYSQIKGQIDEVRQAEAELAESRRQALSKEDELAAAVRQRLASNVLFADAAIASADALREKSAAQQQQYIAAIEGAQRYHQALEIEQQGLGNNTAADTARARVQDYGAAIEAARQHLAAPEWQTASQRLAADIGRLTEKGESFAQVLRGMSDEELRRFAEVHQKAFAEATDGTGRLGARTGELQQQIDQLRAEQFGRLGIDSTAVLTGIDANARGLLDTFDSVASDASTDFRLIQASAESMLKQLDTPQELERFILILQRATAAGHDVSKPLADAKQKLKELETAADPAAKALAEAMQTLGITSTAAFQTMEQKASAAFDLVRAKFGDFSREAAEGFAAYADASLKAAAAQGDIALEAELAGLRITAAGLGQIEQLDELAQKYRDKGDAAERSGKTGVNAANAETNAIEQANSALEKSLQLREQQLQLAERELVIKEKERRAALSQRERDLEDYGQSEDERRRNSVNQSAGGNLVEGRQGFNFLSAEDQQLVLERARREYAAYARQAAAARQGTSTSGPADQIVADQQRARDDDLNRLIQQLNAGGGAGDAARNSLRASLGLGGNAPDRATAEANQQSRLNPPERVVRFDLPRFGGFSGGQVRAIDDGSAATLEQFIAALAAAQANAR